MFRQKDKFKTTWMHPGSKEWHLIDYVLIRKRDMRDICSVRAMRGADCWTDHRLVRAKVRFVVRPKLRGGNVSIPKWLNVARLKDELVKEQLVYEMEDKYCETTWDAFKTSVYEACEKVLGHCKRKHQDWFNENDNEIQLLLDVKSKALQAALQGGKTVDEHRQRKNEFKGIKAEVQRKL